VANIFDCCFRRLIAFSSQSEARVDPASTRASPVGRTSQIVARATNETLHDQCYSLSQGPFRDFRVFRGQNL